MEKKFPADLKKMLLYRPYKGSTPGFSGIIEIHNTIPMRNLIDKLQNEDYALMNKNENGYKYERIAEMHLLPNVCFQFITESVYVDDCLYNQHVFIDSALCHMGAMAWNCNETEAFFEFMKMKEALQAEKVLGTKGLGEVLKRNEYTAITQYYEGSKEYHKEIVTLGAAFAYELLNTEEDSDYFILKRLLNISEKLAEIFQIYSAKKIFSIVYE